MFGEDDIGFEFWIVFGWGVWCEVCFLVCFYGYVIVDILLKIDMDVKLVIDVVDFVIVLIQLILVDLWVMFQIIEFVVWEDIFVLLVMNCVLLCVLFIGEMVEVIVLFGYDVLIVWLGNCMVFVVVMGKGSVVIEEVLFSKVVKEVVSLIDELLEWVGQCFLKVVIIMWNFLVELFCFCYDWVF